MSHGDRRIAFDGYVLEESSERLLRHGQALPLRPQAVRLLALLLQRAGQLVSREELERTVWGDDPGVDLAQGVNDCVRRIRAVLRDDARSPRYVETLPRRGYRFIGSVALPDERRDPPRQVARRRAAPAAVLLAMTLATSALVPRVERSHPADRLRIAVLPFVELSDRHDRWFAEGLAEELNTAIGSLHPDRFGVVARTSVREHARRTRDVSRLAQQLQVDYVLEGSVRRHGDRARITAALVDPVSRSRVWTEAWDGDLSDALALQSRIALAVARQIGVRVAASDERPGREAAMDRGASEAAPPGSVVGRPVSLLLRMEPFGRSAQ